jgi:hypothetical protein
VAASLSEIEEFLTTQGLSYSLDEVNGQVITGFSMENYINRDGEKYLQIVIKLEENGEFIKIFTPSCYQYSGGNQGVLFQVLLMISWKTKMIQFEYDHSDGEVRVVIEFPLEDSSLTERQLMRGVVSLAQIIDKYHSAMVNAMEQGVITFDDDEETKMLTLLEQMMAAASDVSNEGNAAAVDGDDDNDGDDDDDMEFI